MLLGVGDQRSIDLDPIAVGKYSLAIGQLAKDPDLGASEVDLRMARRQAGTLECLRNRGARRQSQRDLGRAIRQRENDRHPYVWSGLNHDPGLCRSSARLTKASMKVAAMWSNTGPMKRSSTGPANS